MPRMMIPRRICSTSISMTGLQVFGIPKGRLGSHHAQSREELVEDGYDDSAEQYARRRGCMH